MKITLICNEYPPRPHAGIGTIIQTIARGLHQRGHEVTVVGLGEVNAVDMDAGIKVFTLRRNRLRYIGNLVSRVRLHKWLSGRVKVGAVDVVEVPDSQGLLPFRLNGTTVVVRLHLCYTAVNRITGEKLGRGISLFERATLAKNLNWIGVSAYVLDLTRKTFGFSPKQWTVIPNAIAPPPAQLPEMPGLPEEYVLYAGHVCRRKGADVLARALRPVMLDRPDLHLVYAGGVFKEEGRLVSEDIRNILGAKLAERVHFLGRVKREQVLKCMKGAKAFVFPSLIESFGLVVLEAMSCGVPVVFTKNPPGPEIIEDGVTGLLADPFSPEDFAEKTCRILDNPVLAKRLTENARKSITERFSPERCVEATERFYQECLRR